MKQTLENSLINFQQMLEASPVPFFICDPEGVIKFYNKAASNLWGISPKKGEDKWYSVFKLIDSNGRSYQGEGSLVDLKPGGSVVDGTYLTLLRKDNNTRNIIWYTEYITGEKSAGQGIQCTMVDVTSRGFGELKKATLSAIVESSDDAIISKNLDGFITSWNAGAQNIFGYSEEEIVGKSITTLIPASRLDEETEILKKLREGKKIDHFETERLNKQGQKVLVSITISPIKNQSGQIVGASKIARDITPQVRAQEKIKKNTRNLEIINSIGKSISEDLDLRVILQRVTDATTKLTGAAFGAFFYNNENEQGDSFRLYTLSGAPREAFEKLGMPRHTGLFHPTFVGKSVMRVDDVTRDERYGKNKPHSGMPAGHLPVVSYLAVPVISKTGNVIGALLFGHPEKNVFKAEHEQMVVNIAAQAAISLDNSKLFEQVKSLSEKKDEFIALASHELKTPLTTIKGYLQVLNKKEQDQMTSLFVKKSLEQVNKLNKLVEDLLHMSRIEAGKLEFNLEFFDIKELLLDTVETMSYSYKTHQFITNAGESPAVIEGDKQRIEQAIINLISNAVKYSPEKNKVHISLQLKPTEVEVSIIDEGMGLTGQQQSQLFTRFYRAGNTKGISGLGLGLYLTKQIIEAHQGEIDVESTYGKGSRFFFRLPLKVDNPANSEQENNRKNR